MEIPDRSAELGHQDASMYRTCLPQCQYVIRDLSMFSSKPTEKSLMVLKHLVGYMAAHSDQCMSLKWKGLHAGVFKQYENEEPMVEIFSDADWAADRERSCSLLWWLSGLFKLQDAENRVTFERRVGNICSCVGHHGCDLDHNHLFMASSMSTHDVFVLGFISCQTCSCSCTQRSRSLETCVMQNFMAGKAFTCPISDGSIGSCRYCHEKIQRSKARIIVLLFG